MSDSRAMLNVELTATGIHMVAWGSDAANCMAQVAVAWLNSGCAPRCPDIGKHCTGSDPAVPPFCPTARGWECCA